MDQSKSFLSWLHIGDLHISDPDGQNLADLRRIVSLVNDLPGGSLDFAVLPGDNADDGTEAQYELVRDAIAPLRLPMHILPGDHDFKSGSLDALHRVLGARKLPYAVTEQGYHCLFLDVVSPGSGGPDFRLDAAQLDWARQEIEGSAAPVVVFMHTYPADLREGAEALNAMLAHPNVRCVDMGHTHYNELANDGGTVFMATRSTGQIEEGPPGFSVAAVDGDAVSWRFKPIDQPWPFVLVTRPADHRLMTAPAQVNAGTLDVRAKVLSDAAVHSVEVTVDGAIWAPMISCGPNLWHAEVAGPARLIRVRARDSAGREDQDEVEPPQPGWTPPVHARDGSDRDRIGAWKSKGLLDTQLGPNRNGREW